VFQVVVCVVGVMHAARHPLHSCNVRVSQASAAVMRYAYSSNNYKAVILILK